MNHTHAVIALAASFATGGASVFAAFLLSRRRPEGSPKPRGKQAVPVAPVVRLELAREEPERQRTERAS